MTTVISYSVHKFYKVTDTDNHNVANEEFMRAYKSNLTKDAAVLDQVMISRITEVDGIQTASALSMDDGQTWRIVV